MIEVIGVVLALAVMIPIPFWEAYAALWVVSQQLPTVHAYAVVNGWDWWSLGWLNVAACLILRQHHYTPKIEGGKQKAQFLSSFLIWGYFSPLVSILISQVVAWLR